MQQQDHVLDRLEVSTRFLKRAQYEAFAFDVVPDGVRVTNHSHADPSEHSYLVTVTGETPTGCECPADAASESACKHRLAVAIRRPVREAAATRAAADGGVESPSRAHDRSTSTEDEPATNEDDDRDCDCGDLAEAFPCFDCFLEGRRDLPEP